MQVQPERIRLLWKNPPPLFYGDTSVFDSFLLLLQTRGMASDSPNGSNGSLMKDEKSASKPIKNVKNREEEILEVARKLADQPVQNHDVGSWGILTAISPLSRKLPQGINIILSADEHSIGRCVEDSCYRIESLSVSAKHCTIYRKRSAMDGEVDSNIAVPVILKDTSTNGTYLNRTKLHSAKARLQHGDIISFIHPPHNALAYAFVYREVSKSTDHSNGAVLKRKSEYFGAESKRQKGIGIGAPEGPISLDDVRSLQRSNTELRQQLESHVQIIETIRSENRATVAQHENEMKDLKEKVSSSYLDQIKELRQALDTKQNENDEHNASLAELRHSIDDFKERLQLSNQSRADADEIIHSQRATISELGAQLCEERNLRRGEREKAEADLKSALQRAHSEAQEEIKRQADVYLRQHNEQQEVISKLQESEKESRVLVETLRSKLEDARESLVMSEKKARQLKVQIEDEQTAYANSRKKFETLDAEVRRLTKELESEKVAREEAWAKVSSLELEIALVIRDLSVERQRFQGAREIIILRETQLRAFYSTTEEISALFAKQQEQLKAMQKTLEDEENYASTLLGVDLNEPASAAVDLAYHKVRDETRPINNTQEASGSSTQKNDNHTTAESTDDGSTTKKHGQDENTQDIECTNSDRLLADKEVAADIDGVGTAVIPHGDPNDTERALGTESQYVDERTASLHKCSNLAGDTMQIDDEVQIQENTEPRMEETENVTIRTADLLASEVPGSWAVSTAPSVLGENETPRSQGGNPDVNAAEALLLCSDGQASGSQSNVQSGVPSSITKLSREHRALNAMIEIVAPELGVASGQVLLAPSRTHPEPPPASQGGAGRRGSSESGRGRAELATPRPGAARPGSSRVGASRTRVFRREQGRSGEERGQGRSGGRGGAGRNGGRGGAGAGEEGVACRGGAGRRRGGLPGRGGVAHRSGLTPSQDRPTPTRLAPSKKVKGRAGGASRGSSGLSDGARRAS